jgi:hypothetical protein
MLTPKKTTRPTRVLERRLRRAMRSAMEKLDLRLIRGGFYQWHGTRRRALHVIGVDALGAFWATTMRTRPMTNHGPPAGAEEIAAALGITMGQVWAIADGFDMRRDWLRPEIEAWFALGARLREFGNVNLGGVFPLPRRP